MKQLYFLLAALLCTPLPLPSQEYLRPETGHKVAFHFSDTVSVLTFDVNENYFYFDDGDTIYRLDPLAGGTTRKYGKPADYSLVSYPSFLSLSPDGASLWAGYTDGSNVDARIYCLDPESGLLFVEVKGGTLAFDGREWVREVRGQRRSLARVH